MKSYVVAFPQTNSKKNVWTISEDQYNEFMSKEIDYNQLILDCLNDLKYRKMRSSGNNLNSEKRTRLGKRKYFSR